jgi:hypothetical protein
MDELKDLLKLAVPDLPERADPAADLARGRRLRRRRRLAGLSGGTAVAAAAAAVTVAVLPGGSPAAPQAATSPGKTATVTPTGRPSTGSPAAHELALVGYRGQQAPGYQVSEVPRGWVVQGGNAFALTIAPADDQDKSVDSFLGKLVVMLQSRDVHGAPKDGKSQPVAGQPGRYWLSGAKTATLAYRDLKKQWVVIQAPLSLGWDSARLAKFAAGVKILGNAQPGRG